MDIEEIRQELEAIRSGPERIAYLERAAEQNRTHFVLYTLASLHLEDGNPRDAELLLLEDLESNRDLFDRYESYSLLLGLVLDRNGEIPFSEIEGWMNGFDRMREEAELELEDIRRGLGKAGRRSAAAKLGKGEDAPADAPGEQAGHEMLDRKARLESFSRDRYQFERMLGDYFHGRGDSARALLFYSRYYADMDRPVGSFVPESMRRYVDLLIEKEKTREALVFMGYIVNLGPYMLDDLVKFSDLYYMGGDRVSALMLQMFIATLSDGYSTEYYEKARGMMGLLSAELAKAPGNENVLGLLDIYLTGKNIKNLPMLISGIEDEGVRNFFFYYLRGVAGFVTSDYVAALKNLTKFNEFYPYLADSYFYALVSMYNLDLKKHSKEIVSFAEKAIELKPGSTIAKMTKKYLGVMLGLEEAESEKLLISSEIAMTLDAFLYRGAPVASLAPLVESLAIGQNPYQVALIKLLSKMSARREEFCAYLKGLYPSLNDRGKENAGLVLEAMGETL